MDPSPVEIRPTRADDLDELSTFLVRGFHAEGRAAWSPTVLAWKYLDSPSASLHPCSWVAKRDGRIIGHVGAARASFQAQVSDHDAPPISTLHMMDWLRDPAHPSVGARLMLTAHRGSETQFGFGGSAAGRGVIAKAGYDLVAEVPFYRRVLRPNRLVRIRGVARSGRDWLRWAAARMRSRPVPTGWTWSPWDGQAPTLDGPACVTTARDPERLKHLLRCPVAAIRAGTLSDRSGRVGFGMTSVTDRGEARVGILVDCLASRDWDSAVALLVGALADDGADWVEAYGSTPWMEDALRANAFHRIGGLEFRLRDRSGRVRRDLPFHLTPIEADYAYT